MPRVKTQTARQSKRVRTCSARPCKVAEQRAEFELDGGEAILPGDRYHSWSFRYGGTYYMHVACGYPRRSQLTQSIMGEVYDAIETAESMIEAWDGEGGGTGDLTTALEEVASVTDGVVEQYREAAEHFGGAGENADRADELEGWKDELESFDAADYDGEEPEEGEDRTEEQQEEFDNWVDEQRGEAQGILDNCPL
jgi:hypothetical protein